MTLCQLWDLPSSLRKDNLPSILCAYTEWKSTNSGVYAGVYCGTGSYCFTGGVSNLAGKVHLAEPASEDHACMDDEALWECTGLTDNSTSSAKVDCSLSCFLNCKSW